MRVIITGGTGMIGRALAQRLLLSEAEVILLSRDPKNKRHDLPQGIHLEAWDARTAAGWGKWIDSNTAIVNLAGENLSSGRWTGARRQRLISSRVDAGLAVSHAVEQAKNKPAVVIQASAVGFYGVENTSMVDETYPAGADFLSQICFSWESSTSAVEKFGVRRVIVRTGVVLSKDEGALPKMLLPYRFYLGGPVGSGKQGFSWIHLHDEVAALEFLIRNPEARGIFNLTAPEPVTNQQFGHALGKTIHRPSGFPVPGFVLKLILGEMSTIVLDGQFVQPKRLLENGFTFTYPDIDSALRNLLIQ